MRKFIGFALLIMGLACSVHAGPFDFPGGGSSSSSSSSSSVSSSTSPYLAGATFTRLGVSSVTVATSDANSVIFSTGNFVRFRGTGSDWRYGQVVAYVATTVTISGANMTTDDDDEIQYAPSNTGHVETFSIAGAFADAANTTLLATDNLMSYVWGLGNYFLVNLSHKVSTADTGAVQPAVNVSVNGSDYMVAYSTVSATRVYCGTVNVSTAAYQIKYGDTFEIEANAVGTNDDAKDLSLTAVFAPK